MPAFNIWRFLFCFVLSIALSILFLLLVFLSYNDSAYNKVFQDDLNETLENMSERISRNMVSMCNLVYMNTLNNADGYLYDLYSNLSAYGNTSVVDEEGYEYTYSVNSFESNPVLKFGNLELKNTDEIDALLNNIKGNANCDFAIYLRINADADLLNIISTTSHLGDTYTPESVIFRVSEDGKESRVINSLLLGDSVDELIALANTYVYIRYIPLVSTSSSPRFIGALACCIEEKNINRIYAYLKEKGIKKNGYYWIMEDLDNGDYRYKLSKDSKYDGNLLSENTAEKREQDYITNLTLTARFLRSGESRTDIVSTSEGSDEALVSYLYFEPWNWIIGTTVLKSEIQDFSTRVPSFSRMSYYWIVALFLIIIVLSIIFSYLTAKPIDKFFSYIERNFGKNKMDTDEEFRSVIVDFKLFADNLKDAIIRVDSFLVHMDKSSLSNISDSLNKEALGINSLANKQSETSEDCSVLADSMYALSEKLTKFSQDFKVDAKNTLTFTRQKAGSLRALRKESELLKDIGGGFASRFLHIRNIIGNLNAQLEELKNYADKTKKLSENMESEIQNKEEGNTAVFSLLVEDTNSFYGETAISIVTMKNFLEQMRESIDSSISEMREFLSLMENGILEIDDILEKITSITEQIATQQNKFQEISRGASMQSEAILQVLKIVNEVKRYAKSTKEQVAEFDIILSDLEKSYKKLNK